eukprot:PITA_12716
MNFVPKKETFTLVPLWVRLYSLHLDYWQNESLMAIGNELGHFVKASEATRRGKYTSFARICVEIELSGALLEEIILEVFDEEWVQIVYYDHIPFRCHKCHEHGHIFRDCPLNKEMNKSRSTIVKEANNFQKVVNRSKGSKREGSFVEKEEGKYPVQTQNAEYQKEGTMSDVDQEMEHETTQSDMELEEHKLQEILEKENLDLERFLEQGTKEGVDSLPQKEFRRI